MRISIRIQLGVLVLVAAMIGLAIIAVATWITNYNFVSEVSSSNLALTASIKASQVASSLALMQALVRNIATRTTIQVALRQYYLGNSTAQDWVSARDDVMIMLDSDPKASFLVQAVVLGYNSSRRFIAGTASSLLDRIELPYFYPNGSAVFLGDETDDDPYIGYPRALYPNLTLDCVLMDESSPCQSIAALDGFTIRGRRTLVLGPYHINESVSLISMTNAIVNNNKTTEVLGWMTVVLDAQLIVNSVDSREGLKQTGSTIVVGSTNVTNRFPARISEERRKPKPDESIFAVEPFHFLFSPNPGDLRRGQNGESADTNSRSSPQRDGTEIQPGVRSRDGDEDKGSTNTGNGLPPGQFKIFQYPAVLAALVNAQHAINNAGSTISTVNERGQDVAVGYAMPPTSMVDWVVLVEQAKAEVWSPVRQLRQVLLACVFATVGLMLIVSFPIGHYLTAPIRRLREATRESISKDPPEDGSRYLTNTDTSKESKRKGFRIPAKVKDRHHLIHDELTDLTRTFNAMADELLTQYSDLEDRVLQRTAELEASKKAAEEANQSKSIFIANVSHELKTPLNGILGTCSVLKGEFASHPKWLESLDVISGMCTALKGDCASNQEWTESLDLIMGTCSSLKRECVSHPKWMESIDVIYDCGDLLLKLVSDLLTFSKHQVGYTILDERAFRLDDVAKIIVANLTDLARGMDKELILQYEDCDFLDRHIGELELWGDKDRLVQIVTNLLSNGIKFTPPGGTVRAMFRCVGVADEAAIDTALATSAGAAAGKQANGSGKNRNSDADPARDLPSAWAVRPPGADPNAEVEILIFEVDIKDNGPGVPAPIREQIFEPFFQGELGLDKKYGGTGLGLSICKQLASLMGGSIWLDGSAKGGAKFTARIPFKHIVDSDRDMSTVVDDSGSAPATARTVSARSTVQTGSAPSTATTKAPGSDPLHLDSSDFPVRPRVLIADDNKINVQVVRRMLALINIKNTDDAANGQQAFDRVAASLAPGKVPYDLILMDVQMPVLTGPDATRRIRTELGFTGQVVALTAYSEQKNMDECHDAGMNDFIPKPIRRPRLEAIVRRCLSNVGGASVGPARSVSAEASVPLASDSSDTVDGDADSPSPAPSSNGLTVPTRPPMGRRSLTGPS